VERVSRLLELADRALGEGADVLRVADHHEVVAPDVAQEGRGPGADRLEQLAAQGDDELVTAGKAVRVVDRLEAVDVAVADRERPTRPQAVADLAQDPV